MKRIVGLSVFLLVLMTLGTGVFAQTDSDIQGGDYWVTGVAPDGTETTTGLEIMPYSGNVYTLTWQDDDPAYGVGILNGNIYATVHGDSSCTIAAYEVAENNDLSGTWISVAGLGENVELSTFVGGTDTRAEYTVVGVPNDGALYEGTMTIDMMGDTIGQVTQIIGETVSTGTSLRTSSNTLAIAFGSEACVLTAYTVLEDGSLTGMWTTIGSEAIQTETALPINLVDSYTITGTTPDGTDYAGTLTVRVNRQVYTYRWTRDDQEVIGMGILRGHYMAVGFEGEDCIVGSYFIGVDGTLSGLWTFSGQNTVGSEFAFPLTTPTFADGAFLPTLDGTYSVVGNTPAPDVTSYQATLEIIPQGEIYQLIWSFIGSTNIEGMGVMVGNTLMVAYGGDTCGVHTYRVSPNEMVGVWGQYGVDTVGSETATR